MKSRLGLQGSPCLGLSSAPGESLVAPEGTPSMWRLRYSSERRDGSHPCPPNILLLESSQNCPPPLAQIKAVAAILTESLFSRSSVRNVLLMKVCITKCYYREESRTYGVPRYWKGIRCSFLQTLHELIEPIQPTCRPLPTYLRLHNTTEAAAAALHHQRGEALRTPHTAIALALRGNCFLRHNSLCAMWFLCFLYF